MHTLNRLAISWRGLWLIINTSNKLTAKKTRDAKSNPYSDIRWKTDQGHCELETTQRWWAICHLWPWTCACTHRHVVCTHKISFIYGKFVYVQKFYKTSLLLVLIINQSPHHDTVSLLCVCMWSPVTITPRSLQYGCIWTPYTRIVGSEV